MFEIMDNGPQTAVIKVVGVGGGGGNAVQHMLQVGHIDSVQFIIYISVYNMRKIAWLELNCRIV